MDEIQERILMEVADLHGVPEGPTISGPTASQPAAAPRQILILPPKTDVSGIDIRIKARH